MTPLHNKLWGPMTPLHTEPWVLPIKLWGPMTNLHIKLWVLHIKLWNLSRTPLHTNCDDLSPLYTQTVMTYLPSTHQTVMT